MFHSSLARWLAVFPAIATVAAVAQPTQAPAPATAPVRTATTVTPPPALIYKSALEGYQPFADEKSIPWKEANETVYRRGGWQAYAKEASSTGAAEDKPTKGATSPAPSAHQGHTMPMPAKKEQP